MEAYGGRSPRIRIAAAGDIHCGVTDRDRIARTFAEVEADADLVLLAGDLTTHGDPEEAQALADACDGFELPIVAVLGNHDHHAGRVEEVTRILGRAGIVVLDRSLTVCRVGSVEIGIVGTKGFVGGFPGASLPDFGEPLLREVYAETTEEVLALDRGLATVAHCPLRIVLLHYSPSLQTIRGEPEGIWAFLGDERLAGPIIEHRPDLVLHGHAHSGCFAGSIGTVPVFNVAVHVTGRDFFIFEAEPQAHELAAIAVPGSDAVPRA